MPRENTFRTVGDDAVTMTTRRVSGLPVSVDAIKTTADGRLNIMMSSEAMSQEVLEKIQDLLLIQQGQVYVDFEGAQAELPL